MLNPNLSRKEISDESILEEYLLPKKYKRAHLYAIMSVRANKNNQIKEYLFDLIKDKDKREELFVGTIIHAWLPVLHILENGSTEIKSELKSILEKVWDREEKRLFVSYIKKEQEYYSL